MSTPSDELRFRAEVCRRLADLSEDDERRTLWIERATEWDRLAIRAAEPARSEKPDADLVPTALA